MSGQKRCLVTLGLVYFKPNSVSLFHAALRCNCTNCEKTGYECETDGACMASTYYIEGKEQHVRICITRDNLVPPGQPFYCLSAEGLLNTHCCYEDYCNSIDLKVPGETSSLNIFTLCQLTSKVTNTHTVLFSLS